MDIWTSGEFYSLLCAFVWATAVILFRRAGEEMTPVALTLFKNAIGFGLLLLTLPLAGVTLFPANQPWQNWLVLLGTGALGIAIADTLFFASLNRLGAVGNAVVACLYSPFIAITAFIYLGEPLSAGLLIALAIMIVAIALGAYAPANSFKPISRETLRMGIVLGVASMLAVAVGIVPAKPILETSNVLWATTVRLTGGVLFVLIQSLLSRERAAIFRCFVPGRSWRFALPGAVLGTYLAMMIYLAAMKYTRASIAGVLTQTSTLIIAVLAAIFLKEELGRRRGFAVALGFVGVVVVTVW